MFLGHPGQDFQRFVLSGRHIKTTFLSEHKHLERSLDLWGILKPDLFSRCTSFFFFPRKHPDVFVLFHSSSLENQRENNNPLDAKCSLV